MRVIFVGAGPGDPELLTVKAERILRKAGCCIYAGSLVSPEIIALLPTDCAMHDSAGMHHDQVVDIYRDCGAKQTDVVRLHSGEPAIFGAIAEQMRALDELGIDYEVVPGISSFQAAAAALRIELTVPEVSQTVILTRAAGRTPVPSGQNLGRLAETGSTLCIFLSISQLENICQELIPHYGAECPAAVVYRVTWPDEVIIRGTLADLPPKAGGIERTALIMVGPALGREGPASRLYDRAFSHGYRKGEGE